MATINVLDAAGSTVAVARAADTGRAAATASLPVVMSTEDKTALDAAVTDLAAIEVLLTTQNGYLDGLEALIGATNSQLPAALGAGDGLKTEGNVAHDAADTGGPVKVGGRAVNAEPAAVANNDRANFLTDLVGKLLVLPYSNPENFVSGAITSAMTGTTSTSLVAAPGAGLRNYITTIVVSNAHASVGTDIVIQDGSGGTALMTIPAAAVYGGAVINLPVPIRQPTTNTAIFCANVTTGASTKVSAVGYKGV